MQILALAGIMMVNVIILSKIKIDDIMKASKNENTSVKVPSVIRLSKNTHPLKI